MVNKQIKPFGDCPNCKAKWRYEVRVEGKKKKEVYSRLIGIEVREKYDGISYWQCPFCKTTWDRFSGVIVKSRAVK